MEMPDISRVGVVGAGTMGVKIALRCITFGKEVYIVDNSPQALQQAMDKSKAWLAEAVDGGTLKVEEAQLALARLHPCDSLEACVADVELVIEAVPERLELKRRLFAQIDRLAPVQALIATTSSSIPCSRIANATGRPGKVLNLHFHHPRDNAPLEVMGGPDTAPETLAAGERFVRSLGMMPFMVKREIMGFGLNTIWHEIKKAALRVVAGSHLDFEDVDRAFMLMWNRPQGVFASMDAIGLDVVRDIEMQYYMDSGDERDRPPEFLDRLIAQGRLGVKSGRGFYTYPYPEYERPGWLHKESPWTSDMTIKLDAEI